MAAAGFSTAGGIAAGSSGLDPELAPIQLTEDGSWWISLPRWARWFLQLGYAWSPADSNRRVCIVSTPCEAPAAALIALGAMRRRLSVPDACDLVFHMGRLRKLYETARSTTVLRRVNSPKRFHFSDAQDGALRAHPSGKASEHHIIRADLAHHWHADGEPAAQVTHGPAMARSDLLESLFENPLPLDRANLARTDSAICLVGPVAGERHAHHAMTALQLRYGSETRTLGSLLSVHRLHDGRVSRLAYYNSRTKQFDRFVRKPSVTCVDGAAAFCRVYADPRFAESDLIVVIPRTTDPDQLESASELLGSMSQWYTPDVHSPMVKADVLAGTAVLTLRRDQT